MELESTRGRFGAPQVFAAVLLLLFLAQCGWFISQVPLDQVEANYIVEGIGLLHGVRPAPSSHSPLIAELAVLGALPALRAPGAMALDQFSLDRYRWLVRAPFLLTGVLLGASVWYVARRLYGNSGGYVAVGLYCFTPGLIARSSLVGPEILGAWGSFGMVFAAIAVAHTLYAPRNAILWNRKRITLLGVAIGIMVGTQSSLIWILPLTLALMLWAVPGRRAAAVGILATACAVAFVFLWLVHGASFRFGSLGRAQWIAFSRPTPLRVLFPLLGSFYLREAAAVGLLCLVAVAAYLCWPRTRFFGNTAPLLVALEMAILAVLMPGAAGGIFFFYCLPFLIVFTAGVFADLFESSRHALAVGVAYGAILAEAGLSLVGLIQLARAYH